MSRLTRRSIPAVVLTALTLVLAACSTPAASTDVAFDGTHVGAAAFQQALAAPGVVIVDVRTPEEFAQGHLPGAVNIDVESADFAARVAALDMTAPYAVYCRTANRSQYALAVMADAGHSQTLGLAGGIVAWPGDIVRD